MPAKRRTVNLAPREEPRLFQRGAEPLRPLRVFVSYSSKDSEWCDWIAGSFAALKRDNLITIFRDRTLLPGSNWDPKIFVELEGSDIVLLLISQDFIESEFCYGKEMKRALELQAKGHLAVVPVNVHWCDWGDALFARLNSLPVRNRPLSTFPDRAEGLTTVATGLRRLVKVIRSVRLGEIDAPAELTIPVLTSAVTSANTDDPAQIRDAALASTQDREAPAPSGPTRVVHLPTLCNRDHHATAFERALTAAQEPGSKRLLFGVIEGDERDAHESFVDRLLFDIAPRAVPSLAARAIHDFGLRWPNDAPTGADPFEIFGPVLAAALQLSVTARPELVRATLTRNKGLIAVRAVVWAGGATTGVSAILKAWASLWHSWPDEIPPGRVVIALLLVKYATPLESQRERVERQNTVVRETCAGLTGQNYPGLTICRPADPLGLVNMQDIVNWLSLEEVRRWCASIGGTHRVERALRGVFENGSIPMEIVIDRLDTVMKEFRRAS